MVVFVGGGGPSGECWREEGRPTGLEHHATLHLHFLVHTKTTTLAPLFSLIVSLSFRMDQEKLARMQAQVRIGGKGTARRKKKVVHRSATTDDKKLQSTLKKLAVSTIPGIEEVNMIKDDGTVIHFNNPKVQASLGSNVFAVTGHGETKEVADMLPSILSQMGPESLEHVRRFAYTGGQQRLGQMMGSLAGKTDAGEEGDNDSDDEDVPDLVSNFDEPSKDEANVAKTESSKPADAPAATGTSKKEE